MADMHNEWFAVAMNAAAALEDAANCLRDPDAKKSAMGAAEHIRARIRELDSRTAPADKQGGGLTENEFQHEEFDRMAEERYKVVPTKSGFWPYGVVAGDGERYLYIGHRKDCERVARSLAGAFCDGAFVAHGRAVLAQAAPSDSAEQAQPVSQDAKRLEWIVSVGWDGLRQAWERYGEVDCEDAITEIRAVIDAALAASKEGA